MKVAKWVDVNIDISLEDIRAALSESFSRVTTGPLSEPGVDCAEIVMVLNNIALFFNALTDAQIDLLNFGQRLTVEKYLTAQARRFKIPEEVL